MKLPIKPSDYFTPYFSPDLGLNREAEFDTADLRIIFCFPSDYSTRVISATHFVLYNIVKEIYGSRVFVDFAMAPMSPQKYDLIHAGYPLWYGLISGHTLEDFDIAGISIAITQIEFIEAIRILRSINFPLQHSERINDPKIPFLLLGGVAAESSAIMDDIVDLSMLGMAERNLPRLINSAFQVQKIYGDVRKGKSQLIGLMKDFPGIYYPSAYSYSVSVSGGKLKWNYGLSEDGFPVIVSPDVSAPLDQYGSSYDVQHAYPALPVSKAVLLTSLGCSGAGACSFCQEGSKYGVWRERSSEDLHTAIKTAKRTSMTDTVAFQSFNANNDSNYFDLLKVAYQYFHQVSTLNFRMDSIAYNLEILSLSKHLGALGMAMAVEGFGERVRNDILNKNLFKDEIMRVVKRVFELKFTRVKFNMIHTGFETREDFKQSLEEMQEILSIRDSVFADTKVVLNITDLIHSVGTPLYSSPRVMAYNAWKSSFDKDYRYDPFTPFVDIGIEVNARSSHVDTLIHQGLSDLGRLARPLLLDCVSDKVRIGSPEHLQGIKKAFADYGIDPKEQFLNFDYSGRWNQHIRNGRENFVPVRQNSPYCLKTVASVGRGEKSTCHNCGQCDEITKENCLPVNYRDWVLNREVHSQVDDSGIEQIVQDNSPAFNYAFIFKFPDSARFVYKKALIRSVLVKMGELLGDRFVFNYRCIQHSVHAIAETSFAYISGYDMSILGFKSELDLNDILSRLPEINSSLQDVKIINIFQTYKPKLDILLLYNIETTVSIYRIQEVFESYTKCEGMVSLNIRTMGKEHPRRVEFSYKLTKEAGKYIIQILQKPNFSPFYLFYNALSYSRIMRSTTFSVRSLLTEDSSEGLRDLVTGKTIDTRKFIKMSYGKEVDEDYIEDFDLVSE